MKTNIGKSRIRLFLTLALLLTVFCVSCNKEDEEPSGVYGGTPVPINIVIGGTEEFNTEQVTRSIVEERNVTTCVDSISGLYIETAIELTSVGENIQTRANMAGNSTFRMQVYEVDGTLVHTCDYVVNGTTATVASGSKAPLLVPGTYKFVCYTKNSTTLPSVDGNAVKVNSGDDSGTYVESKTISATSNTLNITFKRQIAQLTIDAVGAGFTNNTPVIGTNGITVSNLNVSGTWVADGSSTNDMELSINTTNVSKQVSKNTPFFIIPLSNKNLSIKIPSLQFDGKTYSNVNVPVNGATVQRKGNYKMTVKFSKKPEEIEFGGVLWAPGNLKLVNGVYSFMESQEMHTNTGGTWSAEKNPDYWELNSLTLSPPVINSGDPCSKVLPEGTWRTPSNAEVAVLITGESSYGTLNGVAGRYFGSDKKLFLPGAGFRDKRGEMVAQGIGWYWTSTPYGSATDSSFGLYFSSTTINTGTLSADTGGAPIRCIKGNPIVTVPLQVTPLSHSISVEGGTNVASSNITTNESWFAISDSQWLTVTWQGTGNAKIYFSAQANTGDKRTAKVTVTAGTYVKTVVITQNSNLNLNVSPVSHSIASAGGNNIASSSVTSNVSWSASSNVSWLRVSPTSGSNNGTLSFSADANTTASSRSATVTVTGGGLSKTIVITQVGASTLSVSPASHQIAAAGGTNIASSSIISNVSWSTSSNVSWLRVSPTSGSNNGTISFSADANTTTGSRSAIVTVTGGGLSKTISVTQATAVVSFDYVNPTTVGASASKVTGYFTNPNRQLITVTSSLGGNWVTSGTTCSLDIPENMGTGRTIIFTAKVDGKFIGSATVEQTTGEVKIIYSDPNLGQLDPYYTAPFKATVTISNPGRKKITATWISIKPQIIYHYVQTSDETITLSYNFPSMQYGHPESVGENGRYNDYRHCAVVLYPGYVVPNTGMFGTFYYDMEFWQQYFIGHKAN